MLISLGRGLSPRQNSTTTTPITIPTNNNGDGDNGGDGSNDTLILSAPITSSMMTANQDLHAFHFDRVVEGYTGNTVRLRRLSDNVESDFGFDTTTGIFDLNAVETWRGTADVDAIELYDQTINGGLCNADGVIAFIRNNIVGRFGADYNDTTTLLTRSMTDGGVGCDMGGTGNWVLTNINMPASTDGFEMSMTCSMNTRKAKQPTLDIDKNGNNLGGNNATDWMFTYGTGNSNYWRHAFFGTFGTYSWFDTTNAPIQRDIGGQNPIIQQYGQFVLNARLDASHANVNIFGAEDTAHTLTSATITDIQSGLLDNKTLVIGGNFTNNNGSLQSTGRANMLFGGIVITKPLTALESYFVQSKMGAIGQQHLQKSKSDIEGLFDEAVYMKDVNTSDGVVTGINNKLALDWNNDTTSTTNFNHQDPQTGLTGINNPDQDPNNGYRATDNYFSGTITGTVIGFHIADIPNNQLSYLFEQSPNSGFSNQIPNRSLAMGKDHNVAAFSTMAATAIRDPEPAITGVRRDEFGNSIGDKFGNQETVKYNRNTGHQKITINTNVDGYANWTFDSLANNDPNAPYQFDVPITIPVAQNQAFRQYNGIPLLQVGTFEAPAGYDRNDDLATRQALFLQAVNKSYLGVIGSNIGHVTADIAINNNAGVCDSTDDARICSSHWFDNYEGTIFMLAFIPNVVLTKSQIEEIQVNLWKLFE